MIASAGRLGSSRLRLGALTALLAVALGLSALLAWNAVSSHRDQQRAARRSLGDYAGFAAFVLATAVYREYGIRVLASLNGLPPWGTPALFAKPGADFGCGIRSTYFEYVVPTGALRVAPGRLTALAEQRLTDTLVHTVAMMNDAKWRFRYVRVNLDSAGTGLFMTAGRRPDGPGVAVRGITSCLRADTAFIGLLLRRSALPPSLTGSTPPESLYAVSVTEHRGDTLYVTPMWYPPDIVGSAPLGPEFGDLNLQVTLNPDRAPALLIGGTPSSRVPAAWGLFSLSGVLLLVAVALFRREYRLIGARSDFVSSVSHELRTPLSQILIFTELLKLDRLRSPAERGRALDIVDKETRRLIRLVENVLQFSRTSAPPTLSLETVPVGAVVRDTVEAFRPLADARRTEVALDVSDALRVRAERNALRQVLVNLLDNAVKYGPAGQTIRIEASRDGDMIELAVEDQGPGIPPGDRDRIWMGFERLDREATRVAGSGIGLSVVKSLVERMHGRVWVADARTGGARFVVALPSPPSAPRPTGEGAPV